MKTTNLNRNLTLNVLCLRHKMGFVQFRIDFGGV